MQRREPASKVRGDMHGPVRACLRDNCVRAVRRRNRGLPAKPQLWTGWAKSFSANADLAHVRVVDCQSDYFGNASWCLGDAGAIPGYYDPTVSTTKIIICTNACGSCPFVRCEICVHGMTA